MLLKRITIWDSGDYTKIHSFSKVQDGADEASRAFFNTLPISEVEIEDGRTLNLTREYKVSVVVLDTTSTAFADMVSFANNRTEVWFLGQADNGRWLYGKGYVTVNRGTNDVFTNKFYFRTEQLGGYDTATDGKHRADMVFTSNLLARYRFDDDGSADNLPWGWTAIGTPSASWSDAGTSPRGRLCELSITSSGHGIRREVDVVEEAVSGKTAYFTIFAGSTTGTDLQEIAMEFYNSAGSTIGSRLTTAWVDGEGGYDSLTVQGAIPPETVKIRLEIIGNDTSTGSFLKPHLTIGALTGTDAGLFQEFEG